MFDIYAYVKRGRYKPDVSNASSQKWVLGFARAYHLDYGHVIIINSYLYMVPKMIPCSESQDYVERLNMHDGEFKARYWEYWSAVNSVFPNGTQSTSGSGGGGGGFRGFEPSPPLKIM